MAAAEVVAVVLMHRLSTAQYSIGSQHLVEVTHICNPCDFFVRPLELRAFMPFLELHHGPADPRKLALGSIVLFEARGYKKHVRGQIINARTENGRILCELFALDYGFCEQDVPIEKLKKPEIQRPVPSLLLRCQLEGCEPKYVDYFGEEVIEAMVHYVGNERTKMIVYGKTGGKLIVDLANQSNPWGIANMFAVVDYTCLGRENNTVINRMPALEPPNLQYTYKTVREGESLFARVQSGKSLNGFYVCEVLDHRRYLQDLKFFNEYFRNAERFTADNFKIGNAVGVWSERYKRYERAVIKDVNIAQRKGVALLVDLGIKTNIYKGMTSLKAMSKAHFFTRPAMAIYCTANENQVWYNTSERFLCPGHQCVVTIDRVADTRDMPNSISIYKYNN